MPDEDQLIADESESGSDEQSKQEETVPETTEESMEKPVETTEKEESEQQTADSSIPKLPTWSIDISKRQMTEFSVAVGMFLFLVIVIAAVRGSRSKQ